MLLTPNHPPDVDQRGDCRHFRSEPVGPAEGKRLGSGRWAFHTRYHCLTCDAFYDEMHVQPLPRDLAGRR